MRTSTLGRGLIVLLLVLLVSGACASPRTAVSVEIHDDEVRLVPPTGSEEVALTIVNAGQQPCELVVFITDDVNGPVDPDALPVRDGRVDFESSDFSEIEAAEGVEAGGPAIEPGEQRSLTLGFQGTPVVTRVVLCNGLGDYERGRYAVYRSDGT